MISFLKKCLSCYYVKEQISDYILKDNYDYDFDKLDLNRDGKISMSEFSDYYFTRERRSPTNEEWMQFHFADKTNDGYITKKEFVNYMRKGFRI